LRTGYIARISDCIMSLTMCEVLRAVRTPRAGRAAWAGAPGVTAASVPRVVAVVPRVVAVVPRVVAVVPGVVAVVPRAAAAVPWVSRKAAEVAAPGLAVAVVASGSRAAAEVVMEWLEMR